MSGDAQITLVGTLTADPELRFLPSGVAVAGFNVAVNPRVKNAAGDWVDGEASFYRCNVWRDLAQHCVDTLAKGTRVVVVGSLKVRRFDKPDGTSGTSVDVDVDAVGPELRFATATVKRIRRTPERQPAEDPWATATPERPAADEQLVTAGTSGPPF